jgi:hypothetical protein
MTVYGFRVAHGIAIVHHSLKTKAPRKCGAPPHCAYHERHAANKSLMAQRRFRDRFELDTARFESSQPSHAAGSLPWHFRVCQNSRHFRGTLPNEGRIFQDESLLRKFSISEICRVACPETGCVFAETGSNPLSGRWEISTSRRAPGRRH